MKQLSLLHASAFCLLTGLTCPAIAAPDASPPAARKAPPEKLVTLELPVTEALLKERRRHWYGVYLNGNKVGWGVESQQPATIEGKACISLALEVTMEMTALDKVTKVEIASRRHFDADPPHRAFLIEDIQKMDGQERTVVLRHKEGTIYVAETTEAGNARSKLVPDIDLRLCHATTPALWAAEPQRKPGDAIGAVEFSADKMKISRQTITVLREGDWAGPGGKLPVWEVQLYYHDEKLNAAARVSRSDGSIVNAIFGQLVEIRMEPEKVAKVMPGGEQPDIFLAMSIPADRKLGSPTDLGELVIELSAPEGKQVPEFPDNVNQTAERTADGRVTVRITPGAGKAQPVSTEDRAESLKATPRYPIGEQSVQQLAEKAVAGATDERDKVKKLLRFTDFYIRDSYEIEALSVMDLMRTRKGDCSAHALLFTTLARAAGIPAREANGWMYMGNEYKSFGGHAWNEVVLDGHWVPVDAIWNQPQLDAGHIQQHAGEIDGLMLEGLVSGLKAKVISFKKK